MFSRECHFIKAIGNLFYCVKNKHSRGYNGREFSQLPAEALQTRKTFPFAWMGLKPVSIKRRLRTGFKTRTSYEMRTSNYGLGIKKRTRCKTRTTECVYKNSFKKVKLRERDSGPAWNSSPCSLPCTQTFLWQVMQSILPNVSVMWRRKANYTGTLCRYSRKLKMKHWFLFKEKKKGGVRKEFDL